MNRLQPHIQNYLDYCQRQKRLDTKTLKAYQIDLTQFSAKVSITSLSDITPEVLEEFIGELHQKYRPKTVKRKIASLKAFFHYLEYREIIDRNPFNKIQIRFREPVILPKTIPLRTVETFLSAIYKQHKNAQTTYQKKKTLQDAAVIELLFATGMRISELCTLKIHDVNLDDKSVLIYGKGGKERKIQLGNDTVIYILEKYKNAFFPEMQEYD